MSRWIIAAAAATLLSTPAAAQDEALPDPNDNADRYTIGVGAGFVPDYEGSNDHKLIPAAAIRGKVNGISFATRGTYLYVDLLRRPKSGIDFDFGPIVGVRLNRTGKVKDDLVDALPERKTAIELGGFAGVSFHGLTNPYDTLSYRFDVTKDVASAHRSTVISHSIDFGTPLSRTLYVSASLSGDWTGDRYADYYFSIDADDSLASTLPVFDADGGFKNWKLGLLVNQSLSGDLLNGWSLFGLASYGRLAGDYKDSPITDLRGSPTQTMGAIGVGYSW